MHACCISWAEWLLLKELSEGANQAAWVHADRAVPAMDRELGTAGLRRQRRTSPETGRRRASCAWRARRLGLCWERPATTSPRSARCAAQLHVPPPLLTYLVCCVGEMAQCRMSSC